MMDPSCSKNDFEDYSFLASIDWSDSFACEDAHSSQTSPVSAKNGLKCKKESFEEPAKSPKCYDSPVCVGSFEFDEIENFQISETTSLGHGMYHIKDTRLHPNFRLQSNSISLLRPQLNGRNSKREEEFRDTARQKVTEYITQATLEAREKVKDIIPDNGDLPNPLENVQIPLSRSSPPRSMRREKRAFHFHNKEMPCKRSRIDKMLGHINLHSISVTKETEFFLTFRSKSWSHTIQCSEENLSEFFSVSSAFSAEKEMADPKYLRNLVLSGNVSQIKYLVERAFLDKSLLLHPTFSKFFSGKCSDLLHNSSQPDITFSSAIAATRAKLQKNDSCTQKFRNLPEFQSICRSIFGCEF